MKTNIYIYIFVMAFATWCMRVIPSLVMRKPIGNRFAQSFLYYVPYAVLGAMTFPAVFSATGSLPASLVGTVAALILGWMEKSLLTVAAAACAAAFLAGLIF